ncbi:MAG: RNA methyltransferase [Clostridia bacterium]|nr:RNA methyltransferase [Clostridia bacterium]
MMIITSKENPVVKQAAKLVTNAKARKKEKAFITEGLRLCRDVAQSGGVIRTAFMTESFGQEFGEDAAVIAAASAHMFTVSDGVMQHLSDTDSPQGVLCICEKPDFLDLPQKAGQFVVLENVGDPANVGAIARTAEALGVDGLLVSGGCDVYHPKALRASMGALLRLPVYEAEITEILTHLHSLGVSTHAAVVYDADCAVTKMKFNNACAVIIGNEANGITPQTAKACNSRITIPMAGRAESLNAAAAACILIWEMTNRGGDL